MTSLENQENQIYHECKKQKDIVGWLYIHIYTHTHTCTIIKSNSWYKDSIFKRRCVELNLIIKLWNTYEAMLRKIWALIKMLTQGTTTHQTFKFMSS